MLYVYRLLSPLRLGWLLVCCLYKENYLQIFKRASFWIGAVAGSGKVGPVTQVNHTSWVAVNTPTDRPKSVRNRCVIELFCGVVCVVSLPFWLSVGVGAFVIGLSQISSFFSAIKQQLHFVKTVSMFFLYTSWFRIRSVYTYNTLSCNNCFYFSNHNSNNISKNHFNNKSNSSASSSQYSNIKDKFWHSGKKSKLLMHFKCIVSRTGTQYSNFCNICKTF